MCRRISFLRKIFIFQQVIFIVGYFAGFKNAEFKLFENSKLVRQGYKGVVLNEYTFSG